MAQVIDDALTQTLKANWRSSEGTREFIKELTAVKDAYIVKAMNLSVSSPLDKDLIHINMCRAKEISDIIALIGKPAKV